MDNIKINRQQLRRIILKEFLDTSQGRGGGGGMSWEQVTQQFVGLIVDMIR